MLVTMKTPRTPALLGNASPAESAFARGMEMRRVATRAEWGQARSLRYEALRHRGEIEVSDESAYGDKHDAALNSVTFLLSRNATPLGCTRSSVSSANRRWLLPASETFEREIQASIGLESTIVEASLMVIQPDATLDPKNALFHLFKAHMLHCAMENADWLVVAVRDSQIGFYRRMFNMEILSGAERVPGMASARVLMGFEYRQQAPVVFKRIPAMAVTEADERDFAASGVITFDARRGATAHRRTETPPYLVAGD
jgi:N-acyl amino acid synthase FeeM